MKDVTFTNGLGELIAPLLIWVRGTGFFEAHVYMSAMTVLAIPLFLWLQRRLSDNETFRGTRQRFKSIWLAAYFGVCFLLTNVIAVAFKTLIVEELDYPTRVWYEAHVSTLHFYIASVCAAYLWLMWRNRHQPLDLVLIVFVQVGLIGGYAVAVWRVMHEPFSLDVTAGISGVFLGAYFLVYNRDLYLRFVANQNRSHHDPQPTRSKTNPASA